MTSTDSADITKHLIDISDKREDSGHKDRVQKVWKSRDCPVLPGHILHNRYKIVREIDSGRFCTVWEATDPENHRYAVKIFKRGESYREYFENELLMLGRIGTGTPHIVHHVDAFVYLYNANPPTVQCPATALVECGGQPDCNRYYYPCIVFELLGEHVLELMRSIESDDEGDGVDGGGDGDSEDDGVDGGDDEDGVDGGSGSNSGSVSSDDSEYPSIGLNVNSTKNIIRSVLNALVYLHQRGLIHTDVKPENILLCKRITDYTNPNDVQVKLGDLGSTTPADDLFSMHVGTHEYIAPEIAVRGKYSYPSDMWSIGCLIYELMTNEPLFDLSDTTDDSESESSGYESDSDNSDDMSDDTDVSMDENEYTTNLHHLILMECVLGAMPKKAVKGKHYSRYFSKKGKLKNTLGVPIPPATNIRELLFKFELSVDDVNGAADLIEACLRYRPSERITAEQALKHPWLR